MCFSAHLIGNNRSWLLAFCIGSLGTMKRVCLWVTVIPKADCLVFPSQNIPWSIFLDLRMYSRGQIKSSHSIVIKTLQSRFKNASFDQSFYRTIAMFVPLIYARLAICTENLLLLCPLIARHSTEIVPFVSFQLLRRRRVGFWMHWDVHFCFSSLLFSPLSSSRSFI